MAQLSKLLEKARNGPKNLRFDDLRKLVEGAGFVERAGSGTSHRIYSHPALPGVLINIQRGRDGKAKAYQVRQVLDTIDEHDLLS
jgi:hypothetical protein